MSEFCNLYVYMKYLMYGFFRVEMPVEGEK